MYIYAESTIIILGVGIFSQKPVLHVFFNTHWAHLAPGFVIQRHNMM